MYYFLSSNDDKRIYSLNVWNDFTVNISPPIYLHRNIGWKLSLLQLDIDFSPQLPINQTNEEVSTSKYIYVYCDLISQNNVIGEMSSIINYLSIDNNSYKRAIHFSPPIPYCFPINSKIISSMRIYLKDEHGKTPSLDGVCSRCTLQIS